MLCLKDTFAVRRFRFGLGSLVCSLAVACGGKSLGLSEQSGAGAGGSVTSSAGSSGESAGLGGGGGVAAQAGSSGSAEQGGDSGLSSTEGGAAGASGTPLSGGVIVVGTTEAGTAPAGTPADTRYFIVLLDPLDGHELARTQTMFEVRGIAYEAARDKWFVFTGTPGLSSDAPSGPLLVGSLSSDGFDVEQTAMVPKPSNQNTIAVLDQRILYRSSTHAGVAVNDDVLTLLDTSGPPKVIGSLTIPYRYALLRSVARPADNAAGGRVFFLHDNADDAADNCVTSGEEAACSVYESSLLVSAPDTSLTLPTTSITTLTQIDRDASVPALDIQPSGGAAVIVTPPRRGVDTHASIYAFDAASGASLGAAVSFPLGTSTKLVDPASPLTIPSVAVDPCENRIFTSEIDNTQLLYTVPFDGSGSVTAFDPSSQNGSAGAVLYEPFTKTLLSYIANSASFSLFQITGTPAAPQFSARPWQGPTGLVPSIVLVKNPLVPPC
jgi:hypothetical protein